MASPASRREGAFVNTLLRPTFAVTIGAFGAALLAFAGTSAQSSPPAQPHAISVVLNEGGDSLAVIDPEDGRVLAVPDIGDVLDRPHLATFDPVSHRLYVGNKGANLAVFDMA